MNEDTQKPEKKDFSPYQRCESCHSRDYEVESNEEEGTRYREYKICSHCGLRGCFEWVTSIEDEKKSSSYYLES